MWWRVEAHPAHGPVEKLLRLVDGDLAREDGPALADADPPSGPEGCRHLVGRKDADAEHRYSGRVADHHPLALLEVGALSRADDLRGQRVARGDRHHKGHVLLKVIDALVFKHARVDLRTWTRVRDAVELPHERVANRLRHSSTFG